MQINRPETAEGIYALVKQTLAGLPKVSLDGVEYDQDYAKPRSVPAPWKSAARSCAVSMARPFAALSRILTGKRPPAPTAQTRTAALLCFPPPPDERLKGKMYAQLALRYEEKQRPNDALSVWKQIAALNHLVARAEIEGGEHPPVGYTHITD
jgi:hypothetical protein